MPIHAWRQTSASLSLSQLDVHGQPGGPLDVYGVEETGHERRSTNEANRRSTSAYAASALELPSAGSGR